MAISATGVSWLTLPNDPISLITQYQSIAAWGYETEEPLRFPLFVINPFGGFAQKNIFSVLLATACLISLYVGYQLTRPAKSALFFIVCAACLLTSYVIGLLGTLTAILGLTCGITFLAFDRFLRKAWDLRSASLFLIVITGLLIGDWDPFDFSVYDYATAKISTESRSIICRLTWWEFNLKQLLDNPLSGSGLDSFSGLFMEYAYQKPEVLENCEATPSHSHNLILHLIGETGLFGLIFIAGPVAIWFIKCLRRNTFFVVLALLSPIAFHTNTEWPLHTSMLTWFIMLTIPIAFGTRSDDTSRTKFSGKFIIATGLMVCALYGAVTTAAHRAVSLERYIIQRSTAPKQIELLIKSKYRTHPAFRPIYEIAINRALLDIAVHQKDYDLIKRSLIDYRKSIGPIAGHSEINRIYKARQVLSDLSQ